MEQIKENLFFYSAKFLLKLLATEGNPAWPLSAVKIASVMKSVRAFFTGKDWYIWGAGCYGQSIKGVLDAIGIRIQGFIDSSPEKQGKEIGGLCIYKWEDVADGARNVFIAMKNRDAAGQVQERVRASSPTASVCSFDDLRAILSIFLQ